MGPVDAGSWWNILCVSFWCLRERNMWRMVEDGICRQFFFCKKSHFHWKVISKPTTFLTHSTHSLPLLLQLSRFSRVRLCATPETAAHQAPPSLGFSRQEHWSGLPFPSLVHGSEKWKWSRSLVSNSSQPHGLQPTRLLCPWDFPGRSPGVGAVAFSKTFTRFKKMQVFTLINQRIF